MAVTNFIPDLWSAKLLVALRKAHVSGALVNRDYEGQIKRQGDSVKITSINDVTIGSYTAHSDITVEDIDDATRSLLIDQAKYFAVELDDIEAAQHVKGGGSPLSQAVDNAAYQLADTADAFLLDLINDAAEATGNDLGQWRHGLGDGCGGGPPAGNRGLGVEDANGVGCGGRYLGQRRLGRRSANGQLGAGGSQGGDLLLPPIADVGRDAVATQVRHRSADVAERGGGVGTGGGAVVDGAGAVDEGVEELPERGGHQRGARSAR